MPILHICAMDLRQIRTFVSVAEHGTVSKAAEILRITQPALSRQISSLEDELGFSLFNRVGRRLVLTARGEQLLSDSRNLLTSASALGERARALRSGDIKSLKIAASAITIAGLFPTFLGYYAKLFPDMHLSLAEADAADHLSMLEHGDVHLSVNVVNDLQVDGDLFAIYPLPQFQVMVACAPSFPADLGPTIDIRRLGRYPLLLLDESVATRRIFDSGCRLAGVRPEISVESIVPHTLLALAEAGHGIAVVPSILKIDSRSLRVMRVTHHRQPLNIALAVLWDRRRMQSHYAEAFSEVVASHIREAFPWRQVFPRN